MCIFYKDGGLMLLNINSIYSEIQVQVLQIFFMRDRYMFLFVIIWFMYVVEGNIDVDSVKVDDK